jgi:hypothetical protein
VLGGRTGGNPFLVSELLRMARLGGPVEHLLATAAVIGYQADVARLGRSPTSATTTCCRRWRRRWRRGCWSSGQAPSATTPSTIRSRATC